MPASPVLIPQREGEQVPLTQINTQGPFSAQLAAPAFVAPEVKETGFGGAGHALLAFANNFLQGASHGRLRQFQQSELTKKEHENNYDAAVQHIMDSPQYTQDFKEQVYQQALTTKASAGVAALGKGKGGKNEHPMIGLARGIFGSIVGPSENKDHVDIGPEHVSDLMSQMRDPNNQFKLDEVLGQTNEKLNKVISDAQAAAKASGTPLYQDDIQRLPGFVDAVRPLIRQGINPLAAPTIQGALASVPPRPSAEQALRMAKDQAELTHFQEQGAYQKGKLAREANMPVPWSWTGEDGQPKTGSIKFSTTGEMQDLDGKPIPAGDPRKTTGINANSGTSWSIGSRLVPDADGNIVEIPTTTIRGRGTPPPPGAQTPGTSAPPIAGGVQIPAVAPGQPGIQQLASKNNNPGNLMFANQPGAVVGENGFAKFPTPEAGLQALANNINANKLTPVTLSGYISKYAPASAGNDTKAYIENAAKNLGVTPDTALAQIDTNKLAAFQAAQESHTIIPGVTTAPPVAGARIVGKKPSAANTKAVDAPLRTLAPEEEMKLRRELTGSPTLNVDAWDYLLDKRLNVRGMGKDVQPRVDAIKYAGDLIMKDLGLDAGDIQERRAILSSNRPALTKLTTQGTMIKTFEDTLLKNTEVAKQLSADYPRFNLQFANNVLSAFKTGKGDSEAVNLAGQIHTVANEWVKVLAGSTSAAGVPVKSVADAEALIGKAMSDYQLNSFIEKVIKKDASNRTAAFQEEQTKLLNKIHGVTEKTSDGSHGQVSVPVPGGGSVMVDADKVQAFKAAHNLQ